MQSCKHHKTAVSKGKVKKQVAVKQLPKSVGSTASHSESNTSLDGDALVQQKLSISEKDVKASKLFSFIVDWYGVPYKYGGCQKTGVDCSCFVNLLCDKVYGEKLARSAGDMYEACEKIPVEDIKEGDLVFFKINCNSISHVGIYLRNKLFAHASTSKGVMISSIDEPYFKKYFHSGGRVRNL